jgi:antitoxin component YwqK of YwqJK toxin-antitoxin module
MKIWLIILGCCLFSCQSNLHKNQEQQLIKEVVIPAIVVNASDSSLHLKNGKWYFHDSLFSGTIQELYPFNQQIKSVQTFYKGKEEGWLKTFNPDGIKEMQRYFHDGDKDSVHTSWWHNGNKKLEIHFSKGNYNGLYQEWYENGQPFKYVVYETGNDMEGKAWRPNGKLYMNFINKNGRRYGLLNSQMCFSLKNENGEYSMPENDTLK